MRKFLVLAVPLALALTGPALAADPTIAEVHSAAAAGHVDQALGMMQQVLKDHPNSAKAHYVEAELYARQHDYGDARTQLAEAERLAPGLPFANAHSKNELKQQLSGTGATGGAIESRMPQRASIPWGMIAVLGLAIMVLFFLFRRRQQATVYPAPISGPSAYGNPGYGSQGGPWGGAPTGGGMGSGILGGLATGAAMGAGFAAGEEVVNHLFGGDGARERIAGGDGTQSGWDSNANSDMGGDDFGITDDGSWDDGASGGGDDW